MQFIETRIMGERIVILPPEPGTEFDWWTAYSLYPEVRYVEAASLDLVVNALVKEITKHKDILCFHPWRCELVTHYPRSIRMEASTHGNR